MCTYITTRLSGYKDLGVCVWFKIQGPGGFVLETQGKYKKVEGLLP